MRNLPTFTMNINPMKVDIPVPWTPREIDYIHFYEGKPVGTFTIHINVYFAPIIFSMSLMPSAHSFISC